MGALLYLAICGSAVTFTVYYRLLAILPASRLALITYAMPVVAVAIGTVTLDEPVTLRLLAGRGAGGRRGHPRGPLSVPAGPRRAAAVS